MEQLETAFQENINQVLIIAKEREAILQQLKQALIDDNMDGIKQFASKYCGLN